MSERKIYKYVAIIGVDGAGNFFSQANTPNMDKIFANGATSYDALTAIPTISAECWGAMLLGVTPEVHGLTNTIVSEVPYDVNSPVPSVFRVAHNVYPDAQYAAFCNWNPIYNGIIEHNLGVVNATGADNSVTDHVCEYLENHEPKVLFVQFDQVDGAGHGNGYGTPNHLKQIEISDAYIGRIYDMYVKRGLIDDTLFIVSADHGGTPGGSHGGITEAEKRIFIGFAGETVNHITLKDLEVRDIAAVTVCALGIDRPKTWSARVPMNLFSDVEGDTERPEGLVK